MEPKNGHEKDKKAVEQLNRGRQPRGTVKNDQYHRSKSRPRSTPRSDNRPQKPPGAKKLPEKMNLSSESSAKLKALIAAGFRPTAKYFCFACLSQDGSHLSNRCKIYKPEDQPKKGEFHPNMICRRECKQTMRKILCGIHLPQACKYKKKLSTNQVTKQSRPISCRRTGRMR